MGIGFGLSQVLTLRSRQELRQEHRIALKQELSLKIIALIDNIQQEIVGGAEELFQFAINRMLEGVKSPEMQEGLRGIWSDYTLQDLVLKYRARIVAEFNEQKRIQASQDVALHFLWEKMNGRIVYEDKDQKDKAGNAVQHVIEPDFSTLSDAIFKPDKIAHEKANAQRAIDSRLNTEGKQSFVKILVMVTNAEIAAKVVIPVLMAISNAIMAGISIPGPDKRPLLHEFLLEYLILEKFNFEMSDRLAKRFVKSFLPARSNHSPERFENAFTNIVAEVSLVAMGVLDPSLFCMQKKDSDDRSFEWVCRGKVAENSELASYLNHLDLKPAGKIFWNRWNVLGKQLSIESDNAVRHFITKIIRRDQEELCHLLDFKEIFKRIVENNTELEPDDRGDGLMKILLESFGSSSFQKKLKSQIKDYWFPEMLKIQK